MSIQWSTPSGVPSATNYDTKFEQQQLPQHTLPPTEQLLQVILPKTTPVAPIREAPEKMFEMTSKDVETILAQQQERNKEPDHLISKSYVEEQRILRNSKAKKSTIKIKFPDNTELIKNFHPLQNCMNLYDFVASSLREQWKFGLKMIVGKRNLIPNDDTTFAKLGFIPGVVLIIVFEDLKSVQKPYLNDELMKIATVRE